MSLLDGRGIWVDGLGGHKQVAGLVLAMSCFRKNSPFLVVFMIPFYPIYTAQRNAQPQSSPLLTFPLREFGEYMAFCSTLTGAWNILPA